MENSLLSLWVRQAPNFFYRRIFWLGLSLFFVSTQAWSDDESHGVLAGGVVHNIASDRKVEKIGGILQPEPLDLYLKRLFDGLSKKIDQMDQRLQSIEAAVRHEAPQPVLPAVSGTARNQKK